MADRRLVCAVYGGGHIRACLPVLEVLRDRGWQIDLLALTIAAPLARAAGFEPLMASDLLRTGDDDIRRWGEILTADLAPGGVVPNAESVAYLGFGYAGLVEEFGEEGAAARYAELGRRALRPTGLVERLLDRGPFDVALATSSPRAERALIECADARGVPTVCLNNLFAPRRDAWMFEPTFAERICVINEFVRQQLIAGGQDAGKIVVTGNPAFAEFMTAPVRREPPADRLRVLYISQLAIPSDEERFDRFRRMLSHLAASRPDWRVTVRPAPSEPSFDWIAPPLRREPPGTEVIDSLAQADVIVSHGSTMALEGALLGLPIVLDRDNAIAPNAPLDQLGLALPLDGFADLETAIVAALHHPQTGLAGIPRDPTERVTRVIEELGA